MVPMDHDSAKPGRLKLSALSAADLAELQAIYTTTIGQAPPRWASRAFLEGNLAWALQTQAMRCDPHVLRRKLLEGFNVGSTAKSRYHCQPGTRLIREWQGQTHEVLVGQDDYLWRDQRFSSLSRIATEITGVKWSGPRFFGLKRRAR